MRNCSRSRFLATASLLALLAPATALAERPLTYRQALEAAQSNNPALGRAEIGVTQAEAGIFTARGVFDPALSVGGTWRKSAQRGFFQGLPFKVDSRYWDFSTSISGAVSSGTTWSVRTSADHNLSEYVTEFQEGFETESIQDAFAANLSVGVTQQLLRGMSLAYNLHTITQARDGLTVAELGLEQARQQTLSQAASAYWSFWYQMRLVELSEQSVEIAEEALRIGSLRVASGELAPVEQTRLEAALVRAETEALAAQISAEESADRLLLIMGDAPGQPIIAATPPGEVPVLELDATAAIEVALAQNLDLALARARLDAAKHDATYSLHSRLPSLAATLGAGVGNQDESLGAAIGGLASDSSYPYVQLGGQLDVPLGNRAARGSLRRSRAVVRIAELDVEELERSIRAQVEHQVRTLRSAARMVELADITLRLAEETLEAELALAEAGRAIQKDVLEARTEVHRARIEATKARSDYRLAKVELLRLQGQIGDGAL